jgi:hypothetical protein
VQDLKGLSTTAPKIIETALRDEEKLVEYRSILEDILPDTNDEGSWECSYALNAGSIILSFCNYLETCDITNIKEAITLYFDTVDFKVQQELEKKGNSRPTEREIANNILYITKKNNIDKLKQIYMIRI